MVRDFQSIIGRETREQLQTVEGCCLIPDRLHWRWFQRYGAFHPFLDEHAIEIYGVEAAGHGLKASKHAWIAGGRAGVLHGNRTYLLMDDDGQTHSISAVSTIRHRAGAAWLNMGRVQTQPPTKKPSRPSSCAASLGIIPASNGARSGKGAGGCAKKSKDHLMVVNLPARRQDLASVEAFLEASVMSTRVDKRFAALKAEGAPRWSHSSWRAIPTTTRRSPSPRLCREPGPTSSRSACPSPTPWPTALRSRRQACAHSNRVKA